uniref:Uncharacterized protein n=1 Tax=Oryza meridionalis TaxID=40149 RepID=A0A0E0FCF4_9ORYZ
MGKAADDDGKATVVNEEVIHAAQAMISAYDKEASVDKVDNNVGQEQQHAELTALRVAYKSAFFSARRM